MTTFIIFWCPFTKFGCKYQHLSRLTTKPTKWHVHPAKTQISLGIFPVWSESLLSAWRKVGSLATHWAHSEDSDQTGRTYHFVGFVVRRLISSHIENDILWHLILCHHGFQRVKKSDISQSEFFIRTLLITANLFTTSVEDAQGLKSPWFCIHYNSNSV